MSSKPSVNLTLFEPVVYLRGQSATGQDSRGRRRQVNFDAPPSQLRGLLTLHLPKPSKIKNISITLNGIARTDWPEGIGTNRLELAEETPIIKQTITLFNAKTDSENQLINGGRKRSNSVGPGIGLNDDVDWDLVPNRNRSNSPATSTNGIPNLPSSTNSNKSSTSRRSISRDNSNDFGDHHNPSNASNLARSIGNAAARASSAILPPSIRGEVIGSSKAKEREREEKRALHFQQQQQELEKRNKEKNHPTFKNGTFDSFRNPRASTSPSPPGIVSPNHSIHSGHTVSPNASRPNSRNGSPSSSRLPFGKNKDKIKVAPPPREHFQSNLAPSAASASTSSSSTTSKSAMKKREVEPTSSEQKNANQNEAPPDYSYYSSNSPDTSSFISQTNTVQSAPLAERKGFDWNQKTSDELRRPLASSPLSSIPNTPDGSQVATSWMNSTTTSTSTSPSGVDSPMSFSNASSTLFNTRSNESAGSAGAASERSSGDNLVERSGSANVGVPETIRDAGPGGKSILHHNRQESHSVEGAKPGVRFDSNAVESSSPSISNDTGLTSTSLPASPATNRSSQFASLSPSFSQTQFASTPSSTTASAANSASNSPVGSTIFQPSGAATKIKKTGFKGLISGAGNKDKEKESSASNSNSASKDNRDGSKSNENSVESEWKEFKKGTYTYPICIPLPSNLPPTLHSDFGSNAYILKAFVHRHGALTPNLITEREVTLVHAPDEDGMEESDAIVVERNWEDALSYMVVLYGKSFPVGGKIPIWCKFVPLDKVRIHKIVATIEEKTDYFAKGRRVARHEIPRRWTVLRLANADSNEPLLPIISDASDALSSSPLTPLAQAASGSLTEETDLVPSLMDPTGPWELYTDLVVPTASGTRINISTNHQRSNIAVHHLVRLSIRVEKVQDSSKDKKKLFDIIIEVPLSLTHSRTAETLTRLPDYWNLANEEESQDTSSNDASNGNRLSNRNMNHSSSSQRSRSLAPSSSLPPPPPPPTVSSLLGAPSSQRSPSESHRFTRDPQDPVAAASNPLELSRRWLALSVNPNQPGNSANSNAPNGSNGGAGPTVDPRGSDWAEHEAAENASNPPPSYQDTTNNNPRARNPYNSGVVGGVSSWGVSEA